VQKYILYKKKYFSTKPSLKERLINIDKIANPRGGEEK